MADVWGKLNLKDRDEIVVVNAPASFEPEVKALTFFLAFVTKQKEVDDLSKVIDEDWTGERFRRVAFIKNLTRDPRALVSKEGKKRVAR